MQTFDVVIIGGGMVGTALALALGGGGLRVALVEQQTLKASALSLDDPWQPRVSALNEASVRWFDYLGVWQGMVAQRFCPYTHMTVWDGEGTGHVEFDARAIFHHSPGSPLGYIVENDVIRNALLHQLADSTVQCFDDQTPLEYRLSGQGGEVVLADGDVLQAPLLVAADGAQSKSRQLSGIAVNQKDYHHHALVTTVETEFGHQDTARQVFLDSGPLAFLPLSSRHGRHYCSIVWSLLPDEADRIEALDDEAFCAELGCAFEHRAGKILGADPRLRFPLRRRHARQYHRQGVVLVGDAAHTIHPLAGQGVNLGLMDTAVLTQEMVRAMQRGDDWWAAHILDRYQRRRRGENAAMMAAMSGFQHLFGITDPGVRWLRNTGLKLTNKMPLAKALFMEQASGLGGDIPEFIR